MITREDIESLGFVYYRNGLERMDLFELKLENLRTHWLNVDYKNGFFLIEEIGYSPGIEARECKYIKFSGWIFNRRDLKKILNCVINYVHPKITYKSCVSKILKKQPKI